MKFFAFLHMLILFLCIPVQVVRQVSCGAVHVVALSEDGLLQAWGNNVDLNSIPNISMLDTIVCWMHLVALVCIDAMFTTWN